jgi:hypothetical protein
MSGKRWLRSYPTIAVGRLAIRSSPTSTTVASRSWQVTLTVSSTCVAPPILGGLVPSSTGSSDFVRAVARLACSPGADPLTGVFSARCCEPLGIFIGGFNMEIGPLLIEQRRIGDEFRVAEKSLLILRQLLLGRAVDPADRPGLEAGVASRTAELERLGKRRLELDASVAAAALQAY